MLAVLRIAGASAWLDTAQPGNSPDAQILGAGYEAPAQFAEETKDAARNVPWAIVLSVVATALCGGFHLAALLFSVQVRPALIWRAACAHPVCRLVCCADTAWLHLL